MVEHFLVQFTPTFLQTKDKEEVKPPVHPTWQVVEVSIWPGDIHALQLALALPPLPIEQWPPQQVEPIRLLTLLLHDPVQEWAQEVERRRLKLNAPVSEVASEQQQVSPFVPATQQVLAPPVPEHLNTSWILFGVTLRLFPNPCFKPAIAVGPNLPSKTFLNAKLTLLGSPVLKVNDDP